MNSLNLLSARVTGKALPGQISRRQRSRSEGNLNKGSPETHPRRSISQHGPDRTAGLDHEKEKQSSDDEVQRENSDGLGEQLDQESEKTPLLELPPVSKSNRSRLRVVTIRLLEAITRSLRWVLSTLAIPGVYVLNCIYDDKGQIPLLRNLGKVFPKRNGNRSTAQAVGLSGSSKRPVRGSISSSKHGNGRRKNTLPLERPSSQTGDSFSSAPSESEIDSEKDKGQPSGESERRSKNHVSAQDGASQSRRSIRIKLHNEDTARRRRQKRTTSDSSSKTSTDGSLGDTQQPQLNVSNIKSPTSPASSLRMTKYPHAPAPPRPLVPRRQPSYSGLSRSYSNIPQKTLIIDLDETLIHSLAKGGRMSSGHMVEVKLNASVGYGGGVLGPQHPILYYVHKRPHCDDFLRKVSKWFNLVVFTASVQEYADPVIDWLEQERKYFSGRFYRQHCTYRNGAFIKDLSSVEPDLSKVMILDNSPLSYIFHEDNAIPIEGWINDPTDNDLLHLVPVLEALQYVTDVRALLALRRGEAET